MANYSGRALRADSPSDPTGLDLRKSRLDKGVSLEDIAENTKISIRFLRAIEAEEFEKLPGGIFTTSYLRQYATAIGVEETLLLQYYHTKLDGRLETLELRVEERTKPLLFRFWSTVAGR
jgi:cytoskeletal protein RodZ